MRAPISVIIPTLDCAASLGPTLACAFDGMMAGLVGEVVLADGGSTDGIAEVARETGARLVSGPRGRGAQLAAGAEAATGDWFLFLHADTTLSPGWQDTLRSHITTQGTAAHFRLRFDDPGAPARLVAGWANLRSRLFSLPYGDQGLLISRALYTSIGGYPAIPLMEDVAIARALRGQLTALPVTATTSAAKYHRDGWTRRGTRNLWLLTRYLLGADPEALARAYR